MENRVPEDSVCTALVWGEAPYEILIDRRTVRIRIAMNEDRVLKCIL